MSDIIITSHIVLQSAVNAAGTFAIAYPDNETQASMSARSYDTINLLSSGGRTYTGMTASYGSGSITLTNGSGFTLPAGMYYVEFANLVAAAPGTPASGDVTNLTGTASININGTVGATTPAAGAFTTLSASGVVTFDNLIADTADINGGTISGITDLAVADGGTGASTAQDARNNLLPTQTGNNGKFLTTNGTEVAWDVVGSSTSGYGLFRKANPDIVAWTKTGNFTVSTATTLYVEVNGTVLTIASSTAVSMPSATTGTDYAIWVKDDETIQATTDFTSAPGAGNWRKIGGFHYAPGGNAPAQAGGNTTAQINEYSFWDLKFRPACPDPRGMTLIAGWFWADVYWLGVDHHVNGTSKYNVTIADGASPPKIPTKFGGNGSTAYANGNWWSMSETLASHGKRLPTYSEFAALAYGTTEASSRGSDPVTTQMSTTDDNFTSRWGVIQATGCLYAWGDEFGGGAAGASWTANTGGRGSTYQMSNAALFGGYWANAASSGSRCSTWNASPTYSDGLVGARGVCDHLVLE